MGATAQDVAALLAKLTARASFQQFRLAVAPTTVLRHVDHPFVRMRVRGPAPWTLVSWNATYRSPTFAAPILGQVQGIQGATVVGQDVYAGVERTFGLRPNAYTRVLEQDWAEAIVCDASDSLLAQWLVLLWAQACFDGHDQRSKQAGRPPPRVP